MRHQWQCLIAFLCFGIALTSSASHREELERAAELAVERAAERAAERAVEKSLDGGNTTTESKLVRESYSNVRKENPRQKQEENDDYNETGKYAPLNDKAESEEDIDDWSIRGSPSFTLKTLPGGSFHAWPDRFDFRDFSDIWSRFSRSEWHSNLGKVSESRVPVTIEKKIHPPVYKPYEIKIPVPVPQLYEEEVQKRIPYPAKVYVQVPKSYRAEQQVPYQVKVDNPAPKTPYKVAVSQPHTVDKVVIPYEVKVSAKEPYPGDRKKVTEERPYPVRIKESMEKPYSVPMERSVPVKISESRPYSAKKPVEVRPYSIRADNKPYELYQPVLVPAKKPVAYVIQVKPVPVVKSGWKNRGNATEDKEDLAENESVRANGRRRSR